MFPRDRGKGSGLKKDLFVLVFGLGCFDFFLYFLSQGYSYVTCQYTVGQITLPCLHVWKIKAVEILDVKQYKDGKQGEYFVL